jgi:putative peptide-modifying radical SAM enzyme
VHSYNRHRNKEELSPERIVRHVALVVLSVLYFVILTHLCNLHCDYCGYEGESSEFAPAEIEYDVNDLKRFTMKDPEASIIFYGGEPLIRQNIIRQIMDFIPAKRYLLQTNALNLGDLESEYLKRLDAILVSIDGRKETTDRYRGNGVYEKILENLRDIRKRGFVGDVIARMTASRHTEIFHDVTHLLDIKDPEFNHVHWQIDALWDSPPELRWNDFEKWITECYDPGIIRLVRLWGESIVMHRKVLPVMPFTGIMNTLLDGSKTLLRCGAGIDSFAVTTSGEITVCPIAPEWGFAKVGSIFRSEPHELPHKVELGAPCTECNILDLCGGRCLFANKTKLWTEKGFQRICRSTRTMIDELKKLTNGIEDLISTGQLSRKEFGSTPYNNGTEIIP